MIQVQLGQRVVDHEFVALPIRVASEFGGGVDEVVRQLLTVRHLQCENIESDGRSLLFPWLVAMIHDTKVQ